VAAPISAALATPAIAQSRKENRAMTSSIPPKAYVINPEQRTITPFEPSSDVCRVLTASLEGMQPPYLGYVADVDGVFLIEGAYCVEDPYGAWDSLQKPWFGMEFERLSVSPAESARIVGNCIVIGIGPERRDYDLRDATITVEELAERVRFQPTTSASQTTTT
jgi:hypothetical protein